MNDEESEAAVIDSVFQFKDAGGGALVENSVVGLNRNTSFLKKLSQKTGVHIVAGTGYYVCASMSSEILSNATVETMTKHMVDELTVGCHDDPSVKCGFIGEIGITDEIIIGKYEHSHRTVVLQSFTDFEKQSIRAAAAAQESTGAPVSFHPGRQPKSPFEIMRIFLEAGGKPEKMILSHTESKLNYRAISIAQNHDLLS